MNPEPKKEEKPEILTPITQKYKAHEKSINHISLFPSGNFASVSSDCSIKIFSPNLELIENIEKAHSEEITYIYIINDKLFISCGYDDNIKIWKKSEKNFEIFQIIEKAHKQVVNSVLFTKTNKIISCSFDGKVAIWSLKDKKFQNENVLLNPKQVNAILLLEDKNLLVSSGTGGTLFFNLNNFELEKDLEDPKAITFFWNGLKRLDDNRIIISGKAKNLIIVDINEKKVIKEIDNEFSCWGILVLIKKGIFLTCGRDVDIKVYNVGSYQCLFTLKNAIDRNYFMKGMCELKDDCIVAYNEEGFVRIFKVNL